MLLLLFATAVIVTAASVVVAAAETAHHFHVVAGPEGDPVEEGGGDGAEDNRAGEGGVRGHLLALVPGDRPGQVLGQAHDVVGHRRRHGSLVQPLFRFSP